MKKLIEYVLYIYTNFIIPNREDLTIYKNNFKPIARIITEWINLYIWFAAIIFFPCFVISMFIDKFKKQKYYSRKINNQKF